MTRDELKGELKQQIARVGMFDPQTDALKAELEVAQKALDDGDTARMVAALGQLRIKELPAAPAPAEASDSEGQVGSGPKEEKEEETKQ